MKLFALVGKLPSGRYISQIAAIDENGPRLLATTAWPQHARSVAAQQGFILKSELLTQHQGDTCHTK